MTLDRFLNVSPKGTLMMLTYATQLGLPTERLVNQVVGQIQQAQDVELRDLAIGVLYNQIVTVQDVAEMSEQTREVSQMVLD